jgi:hypothetical protein
MESKSNASAHHQVAQRQVRGLPSYRIDRSERSLVIANDAAHTDGRLEVVREVRTYVEASGMASELVMVHRV